MSTKKFNKNATTTNPTKAMNIRTFNPTTFTISDWMAEKEGVKQSQFIAFPRVNETVPLFELPEFTMTTYGVTPVDGTFTTSEDDPKRLNVKFPIDPNQKECLDIGNFFGVIDNEMLTTHKGVYGKIPVKKGKKVKAKYVPIVKDPNNVQGNSENEEDEETEDAEDTTKEVEPETPSKYPRHNYFRAKVDQDFVTKKIRTLLWFGDETELVNGKVEYKQIPFEHINDLKNVLRLGCKVKMIISISKLWCQKAGSPPNAGISLKIKQIRITGRKGGNFGAQMTEYAFTEDEIYGDEQEDVTEQPTNETVVEQEVDENQQDETETNENEDDQGETDPSDEDEVTPEPPKKNVKPGPKKTSKKN